MLTHTSGIPNYYTYWDSIVRCSQLSEMMAAIKEWPITFTPGSHYAYSNTGYLLLAFIIEQVTGKSFETYLREAIFVPLGMHASGSLSNEKVIPQKASGYQYQQGVLKTAPAINNSLALVGNGDLYASIDDMYAWIQGLFSEKLLTRDSLEVLLAPHVRMEDSEARFHSYGWFIDSCSGKQYAEYSGSLVGYLSKVIHFTDQNSTIIVLTNCENREAFIQFCEKLRILIAAI